MKSVVVTGAAGFIGRHALAALARRGYSIHAVSRSPAPYWAASSMPNVQWHRAELARSDEVERLIGTIRPRSLLHLAWYTEHGAFWQSPENLASLSASLNLLRAFAEHGGSRFVGAGTCAEYRWGAGSCHETETPLRPASLYGSAKKALFEVLSAYAPSKGLSWAWGRVFFLYGPGEHERRLVPSLIRNCLNKQPAVCHFGQLRRDFLHVEDVADAFAALLGSEVSGPVNIASGEAVELGQVALAIGRICGNGAGIEIGSGVPGQNEPPEISAAIERLEREVGWSPARTLEQGLSQTVEWWRAKPGVLQ
jgi:nucleoside-diphosphate-sugar epimerase